MYSSPPSAHSPRPFQFGIWSILLLTTLGAVVIGIGRAIEAPLVWQLGVAGYVFMLLTYLFFRVPYLLRIAFGADSDWQRVQQRRKELQAMSSRETTENKEAD